VVVHRGAAHLINDGKVSVEPSSNMSRLLAPITFFGAVLMACVAFLVPLFVPPPQFFPFLLDTNVIILSKWLLLQWLALGVLCCGAASFLWDGWQRYRGLTLIPTVLLACWLGWATVSVLVNPGSQHFLARWIPPLMAGIAALCGPMLITTPMRARLVLAATLLASLGVALVGIASSIGYPGFLKFLYGIELAALRDGRWMVQGGARSAAAMSTLANPEYAGTYSAAMVCLWAVVLLDGGAALKRAGRVRLALAVRLLALVALAALLMQIFFTSSRQALITVALLGILRLALALKISMRLMAAGFCLYILTMVVLGLGPALLLLLTGILGLAAYSWRTGRLLTAVRSASRFNLALVVGMPTVVLVLGLLFSIPGPWNPTGIRVFDRFASLLSSSDDSYQERLLMFTLASRLATANPMFGIGPGRYGAEFFRELGNALENDATGAVTLMRARMGLRIGEQSHNDYLQIAAETGLIGLVLFLGTILALLYGLLRVIHGQTGELRVLAIILLIGITAFLSLMQSSFPLHMPSRAAVFWMLVGTALGVVAQGVHRPTESASEPASPASPP
jgi:O-antigen ligase